jgi:hypothetical protein
VTDTAMIPINGASGVIAHALVDAADAPLVQRYKWHLDHHGYAKASEPRSHGARLRMHRLILGAVRGQEVDHINRNPLDNRRCNLRVCTRSQNMLNRGLQSNNRSGYTGVHFDKARRHHAKPWTAYIYINKRRKHVGRYATRDEALAAREAAARAAYGAFHCAQTTNTEPAPSAQAG